MTRLTFLEDLASGGGALQSGSGGGGTILLAVLGNGSGWGRLIWFGLNLDHRHARSLPSRTASTLNSRLNFVSA
jgi:hypothetical protein